MTSTPPRVVGFEKGNQPKSIMIQGEVLVSCNGFGGPSSARYTCRDTILEPVPYDFFIGPAGVDADEVELIAAHQGGGSRSAKADYDMRMSRSRSSFNLWISTLFQRPLLKEGENKVQYTLKKSGQVKQVGSFIVQVLRAQARTCPTAHYDTIDSNDCQSQYSVCQRYFQEFKNCRTANSDLLD